MCRQITPDTTVCSVSCYRQIGCVAESPWHSYQVNLQLGSSTPNLTFVSVFYCVLDLCHLLLKKRNHVNCQLAFNLSNLFSPSFFFFTVSSASISHCSFLLQGGKHKGQWGKLNEDESSHFAIASKPTFREYLVVTVGCILCL